MTAPIWTSIQLASTSVAGGQGSGRDGRRARSDAMLMPVPELTPPETTTTRDWSELPVDVLSVVFAKLGAAEILMGAGIVCSSWLHAAKLPHLWRCVDIPQVVRNDAVCCAMAKVAVDRSDERLEGLNEGALPVTGSSMRSRRRWCLPTQLPWNMEPPVLPVPEPPAETRDWSELPLDAVSVVFTKLGAVEVLMGAGLVCHSWLDAAKVPELWRTVDMAVLYRDMGSKNLGILTAMGKRAVKRSNWQLEVFKGRDFITNQLLKYVGRRSPGCLKSLHLESCTEVSMGAFTRLITKSPLLEDLVLNYCPMLCGDVYATVGERGSSASRRLEWWDDDDMLLTIAAMHGLRRLTLEGVRVRSRELTAIVDGCPHLELLDVSECFLRRDIVGDGALPAKCASIKTLKLPLFSDVDAAAAVAAANDDGEYFDEYFAYHGQYSSIDPFDDDTNFDEFGKFNPDYFYQCDDHIGHCIKFHFTCGDATREVRPYESEGCALQEGMRRKEPENGVEASGVREETTTVQVCCCLAGRP
uniref:F-box domain-containing protein n=1 Tax=Oryza glumipatula TaxID=40148 RepID=A0A0E0ARV2_9ORYZ